MGQTFTIDIAIIGGGIAGLWLLNRLRRRGVDAVLLEHDRLGSGQTLASQGIIHGGVKYALADRLTGASAAIAAMPAVWRACLHGAGEIDLGATRVLSDSMLLWSSASAGSRLATFLTSHALASRVTHICGEPPPPFDDNCFDGTLYRIDEFVVDTPSLVANLRDNCADAIYHLPAAEWRRDDTTAVLAVGDIELRARRFVLAAGSGNGAILATLGIDNPQMQLRPLQQVLARHHTDCPLYGHCMHAAAMPGPRLTVTTHQRHDGSYVWHLGGELATSRVALEPDTQIARAQAELTTVLPWLNLRDTDWATVRIDRAEVARRGRLRPDTAFAEYAGDIDNVVVGWPTKLALAPLFAQRAEALLELEQVAGAEATVLPLPPAAIGEPVWETVFRELP